MVGERDVPLEHGLRFSLWLSDEFKNFQGGQLVFGGRFFIFGV